MSKQVNDTFRFLLSQLPTCGLLLLAGCAGSHSTHAVNQRDAAAYNVQLGIDYMNQGDLARAKDKLDRALKENSDSADVHSARAQLFERMGDIKQADEEYRTALRIAPSDPRMENNYAVYLCQNGRTDEAYL